MTVASNPDRCLFQFAVIADSHIRLPDAVEEGGYASNRLTVERARYVVQCLNRLQPDFVVHLGDLVHPIPALRIHEETVKLARQIFAAVKADFYALPGNHDIGDKPNAWLPAPVVEQGSHCVFEKYWGPLYQSFAVRDCCFICLDTPILNSGFEREQTQRAWLEAELRRARESGQRLFVFMHYPLFICDPQEPTHYDNVDEPARSWLLALFQEYGVEAVFSGHVHNVFVGVHQDTFYYSVPSVAFVRPEYAELATVGPGDEYGRNDTAKLGFFLVRVYADGHEVLPVRTYGAGERGAGMPAAEPCTMAERPARMLGMTLRRGWGRRIELAADGLDEFGRKEAYRDALLIALLELGVRDLRVPFADLANADARRRMADFVRLGYAFTIYSLGVPGATTLETVKAHTDLLANWEIILPEHAMPRIAEALRRARGVFPGRLFVAPVVPIKEMDGDGKTFQHFASHGFSWQQADAAEAWLSSAGDLADDVGLTFRVSPWDDPDSALRAIAPLNGRACLINLQLPRLDEGACFADDKRLATFLVAAYNASRELADATVFVDTFIDSDRGYYPRIGLLDRRFNPRPAFYALKLAALAE